ncbi:MAG: hypothetical protein L6V95_03650 [Candidatus Melainabacteria bacterium]|nr:MAG: hypothetical protein L6V95_03650 [Candidatus Melainabacteria bacterium]
MVIQTNKLITKKNRLFFYQLDAIQKTRESIANNNAEKFETNALNKYASDAGLKNLFTSNSNGSYKIDPNDKFAKALFEAAGVTFDEKTNYDNIVLPENSTLNGVTANTKNFINAISGNGSTQEISKDETDAIFKEITKKISR